MKKDSECPRILVVDDDPVMCQVLTAQFQSMGCETLEAHNGQEAYDLIGKEKITAVMCDIQMPKMNGIEFLEALRAGGYNIPVLIMTGFSHYRDEDIAKSGAVVLLNKPFTRAQLKETVNNFIKLL